MNPAYSYGQKLAEEPTTEEPEVDHYRRNQALLGGAALAGGAYAGSKARPMITGRTRLYHGTTPENVGRIQQEGLKPSSIAGEKSITNILPNDIRGAAQELGYMTPGHLGARNYAAQAVSIAEGHDPLQALSTRAKALVNPIHPGVVSADVPLWHPDVAPILRPNPEARGSLENFRRVAYETAEAQRGQMRDLGLPIPNIRVDNPVAQATTRATYNHFDQSKAFLGGLDAKYFHGSPHYQGVSLKEIGQYARQHPGRFAGGLGLAAAGTAAGAYGAKKLYDAWRGRREEPPSAP